MKVAELICIKHLKRSEEVHPANIEVDFSDMRDHFDKQPVPIEGIIAAHLRHAAKTIQIGTSLRSSFKNQLIAFLRKKQDIFMLKPSNMEDIDPTIICNQLIITKLVVLFSTVPVTWFLGMYPLQT